MYVGHPTGPVGPPPSFGVIVGGFAAMTNDASGGEVFVVGLTIDVMDAVPEIVNVAAAGVVAVTVEMTCGAVPTTVTVAFGGELETVGIASSAAPTIGALA